MSAREPDDLLEELGARLREGYARADQRPWWRPQVRLHRMLVLVAVLTAGASSAIAGRDVLRAPAIPDLPASMQPPGAVRPDRGSPQTYVASGRTDSVAWRLSASSCTYGDVHVVATFLTVPGGGGGTRCDVAGRVPGVTPTPAVLAARRVQTYYDPLTDRTWIFGVAPKRASVVTVRAGGHVADATTSPLDPRGAAGAGIDPSLRAFVLSTPGAAGAYSVEAVDDDGTPVLHCLSGSCSTE